LGNILQIFPTDDLRLSGGFEVKNGKSTQTGIRNNCNGILQILPIKFPVEEEEQKYDPAARITLQTNSYG